MQKLLTTLFIFPLFCAGFSCVPEPKEIILIPDEYKAYVDFPVGSWWVYEDVNDPAKRDSVYVYEKKLQLQAYENVEYEKVFFLLTYSHDSVLDSVNFILSQSVEAYTNGIF
jgi:hypothetical protein